MNIRYDPEADAIYVQLRSHEGRVKTRELGDWRMADYDEDGNLVGVELLFVSKGVNWDGVPERERIHELLSTLGRLAPVA